jgi:hypothetical protein
MAEHTFLVAVTVAGGTREEAELLLHRELPGVGHDGEPEGVPYIESWWVAEDDRRDRSDNDSAVFVPKGEKGRVLRILRDLTAEQWNAGLDLPNPFDNDDRAEGLADR